MKNQRRSLLEIYDAALVESGVADFFGLPAKRPEPVTDRIRYVRTSKFAVANEGVNPTPIEQMAFSELPDPNKHTGCPMYDVLVRVEDDSCPLFFDGAVYEWAGFKIVRFEKVRMSDATMMWLLKQSKP